MVGRPSEDNPEQLKKWLEERLLPVMVIETLPERGDPADVVEAERMEPIEREILKDWLK